MDDDTISWEVQLEGDKELRVDRDENKVLLWQPRGDMRPLPLTRSEALALSEALRRQAEMLSSDRQ